MRGNFTTDRCGKLNPNYKDGRKGTRLYSIYRGMITRCYNSNTPNYKRYGARGITMCDEWKDNFQTFYDWAMSHGYSDELTIERMNVNGNYEPSNCRWVTLEMQANNKSNNKIIVYNSMQMTMADFCRKYNLKYKMFSKYLAKGISVIDAMVKAKKV